MEDNRINYVRHLNSFWEKVEQEGKLKPTSILVYLSLLNINNSCRWKDPFQVTYGQVLSQTGLSNHKTYYSAIKELVGAGFIDWTKSNNQYVASIFSIKLLVQNSEEQVSSTSQAGSKQMEEQASSTSHILKHINKETGKPETPKEINIPFEKFWEIYPKKEDKKKSKVLWAKLTDKERELVMIDVPIYKSTPKFEGYTFLQPTTYLNGKRWEDERTTNQPHLNGQSASSIPSGFGQRQVGAVEHGR